jgi:hypothetical protein
MDYRGTVKGGVIVLDPGVSLPEGQGVVVTPAVTTSTNLDELPGAGMWGDRTDIGDTTQWALDLRRAMERRNS